MRRLYTLAVLLLLILSGCLLTGCGIDGVHTAKPITRIKAGPHFSLENSKDVSVSLKKGGFDPSSKAVTIEGLKLTDNASEVREANLDQMKGLALQAEANWEGSTMFLREASSFVRESLPIFGAKAAWTITSWVGTMLLVIIGLAFGLPLLVILLVLVVVFTFTVVSRLIKWARGDAQSR